MKNTEYELKFVDLIAFEELLEKFKPQIPFYRNKKESHLIAIFNRYSMDQNGYHNGYEYYTIRWKIFNKIELGIAGIPLSIFPYCITPNVYTIYKIQGAERNNKNYCKPDEGFVWQEIDHWLSQNLPNLLEAEYNREDRSWAIGNYSDDL